MLDELKSRIIAFLSQNQVCVIATSGSLGAWAVPAQYNNSGLELTCQLPYWSDVLFYIEQEPKVMAIIQDTQTTFLRWLQVRGVAHLVKAIDDRYVSVRITPEHIDLVDENLGWGVCETLDL